MQASVFPIWVLEILKPITGLCQGIRASVRKCFGNCKVPNMWLVIFVMLLQSQCIWTPVCPSWVPPSLSSLSPHSVLHAWLIPFGAVSLWKFLWSQLTPLGVAGPACSDISCGGLGYTGTKCGEEERRWRRGSLETVLEEVCSVSFYDECHLLPTHPFTVVPSYMPHLPAVLKCTFIWLSQVFCEVETKIVNLMFTDEHVCPRASRWC